MKFGDNPEDGNTDHTQLTDAAIMRFFPKQVLVGGNHEPK